MKLFQKKKAKPNESVRKLVVVGDGMVGKTALLTSFVKGGFTEGYIPTVFETEARDIEIDGRVVTLGLWDTGGQEEFDRIRLLAYPGSHIIIMCYAVDSLTSLENIVHTWHPEVSQFCPGVPILLVGCKSDRRTDTTDMPALVDAAVVNRIKKDIGARGHIECSAKMHSNVDSVFEVAAQIILNDAKEKSNRFSGIAKFFRRLRRRK